ncbi:MAG: lysozyme [Hyphomicrobium sp.]|uniref:lysozyme n=1 Tax=Hyphomicrobium sp. TaxID=82 RepID=UPI003D0B6C0C
MHSFYLDAIRNFEGYTPQAQWDYAQLSNGYGTRARFTGEVIDRAEAERRFQSEVSAARSIVERAAPHVDEGTKAALTSLTYNAGTAWIDSGLGDAVRRGDIDAARDIFLQYNKAGGEVLPGLVTRRSQEAMWIGSPDAVAGADVVRVAEADGASGLPPVIVDGDAGSRAVTELIRSAGASPAPSAQGSDMGVFARGPRTERVALAGPLATVSGDALIAMLADGRLGPGGAAEVARVAQLGRGSELAARDRDDKETRRV